MVRKKEMPVGKPDERLTEAARTAFDKAHGGSDQSLVGKKVKAGDKVWVITGQWQEKDNMIATLKEVS